MNNRQPCPIWGTSAQIEIQMEDPDLTGTLVDSPRAGGKYLITREAEECLNSLNEPTKLNSTGSCLRRPLCRFVFGYVRSVFERSAKQNFA